TQVDIAAPGYGILSTYFRNDNDTTTLSGTSMSTPHVSGAAALLWSKLTSLTNQQVRDALECSARDLGASGTDPQFGHGLLDAAAAIDAAQQGGCPAPPPPPPPPPTGKPDLTVSGLNVTGSGATRTFAATLRNLGPGQAKGNITLRFRVDMALFNDKAVTVDLAPGAQLVVTSKAWGAKVGSHTVRALADAFNRLAEASETNNQRDASFTV
ncbi:MAG: S8 family serine peptidase, partial [Halobacteriales archaeon]|nr:S8 family serine peptidase [Halobacteriales archaeon]